MDTAIKQPMPDQVTPSFVIFDIRALCDAQPGCQKLQMTAELGLAQDAVHIWYSGRQKVKNWHC